MSKILIKNLDIVCLDESATILSNASLAIDGKKIYSLGHELPPDFIAETIIDGSGLVALPGFFNAHCHAAMTYERGFAEDLPFARWLSEKIWVAESRLSSDDVYWGTALAVCEMIHSGVVGFNDHYFFMDRVAELVEIAGVKACLANCVFGNPDIKQLGVALDGSVEFIRHWQGRGEGRIRTALGPHSPYACTKDTLRRIAEIASQSSIPIHIHVAESEAQVADSIREHGKTPVQYLASLGVLDSKCLAAHCLYVSDEDLNLLAEHKVAVAHTPITYMKLAMGVNDLSRFQAQGIEVAIGTDGAASNSDMDMFASLRQTVLLQKHTQRDPQALPGDLALRMASQVGARAMGFEGSGVLEVNAPADFMLIDKRASHLLPCHNPIANLVHCAKSADVRYLFVDGQMIMENSRILSLDEDMIRAKASEGAGRLVGEMCSLREP